MTSLLLWKEHLKRFYNRYSYGIQPVVRFLFALCTMVSLNTNIGYMAKLKKSPGYSSGLSGQRVPAFTAPSCSWRAA